MKVKPDDVKTNAHGELLVKLTGIWGSVCMKGFDKHEADMVCKKMNFKGGVPYLVKKGQSEYPILMSNLQCGGNEKSIDKCSYQGLGADACKYTDDKAGVLCYNTSGKLLFYYVDVN